MTGVVFVISIPVTLTELKVPPHRRTRYGANPLAAFAQSFGCLSHRMPYWRWDNRFIWVMCVPNTKWFWFSVFILSIPFILITII